MIFAGGYEKWRKFQNVKNKKVKRPLQGYVAAKKPQAHMAIIQTLSCCFCFRLSALLQPSWIPQR